MAGIAAPSGWPSMVSGPSLGVRTTQRILLAGLSGCPARSGFAKRNPAASGGWAMTYGTPLGLLCPPASSNQVGIEPRRAAVDPHPPATATGLAASVGTDADVTGGRVAPSAVHAVRASVTTVASTSLTPGPTRHDLLRFHRRPRAAVRCTGTSPRYGCGARPRSAARGAASARGWRPARASA